MAYAIIEMSGKQYRVEKGDSVVVDRLDAKEGAKLSPKAILFADGDKTLIGASEAGKVKVDAVVTEHMKGEKIRVFKYRPKKRYRKTQGHRSLLTRLEITGIAASGGAAKPAAEKKPAEQKPAAEKKPAATKKPATKKPAPKKDE